MTCLRSLLILVVGALPSSGPLLAAPADLGPDRQVLELMDLSQPALAPVRAAVAQADWEGARHALAEHFRTRSSPRWGLDPQAVGRDPGYRRGEADRVVAHKLNSLGIDHQFGEQIDWAFNPTTQPGSTWPRNHEWTWQLNRHSGWLSLARAYYATGDEKYAREFATQLKAWMRDCPVPMDKAANVSFSRWRTIEAGIRAGTVWPEIFPRFLAAKAFDDETLLLMVRGFADHGKYLMKFYTKGNWLTMEANGLYHVGALFPEFKEADAWRRAAAGRLLAELDIQVYPDGAQIELAPGYHGVTIRNFLGPVKLASLTGFEPPAGYVAKMERLFDYFLYSMQPDGRTAPLNDSGAGEVAGYLEEGARLFPQRTEFLWGATGGKKGQPPGHTSHEFPYAGQFIMRSGWGRDAAWLCLDGGPFGFGHQHEDKLGVILTAYGAPLLVEGGVYTYDASDWRRYVLSSRAHNVVLVDGLEQNRRHESRETYVVKTPLPRVWETNATFDHAAARYDEGWGPKAERLVRQTRHVFFLKPDLFVIADQFEPADARPHTYEALFHLDAPSAQIEGLRVATQNPGPNLTVAAWGADGVRIVQGQKAPVVQGWLPARGGGYGGIKPIPTAIYTRTASGPTTLLYALCPSRKAAACPVAEVRLDGRKLVVRGTDGPEQRIEFNGM